MVVARVSTGVPPAGLSADLERVGSQTGLQASYFELSPETVRAQLAADPHAVGIVATEYVSGATHTAAADARPSGYGSWVWHQMQESLMQRFFPDD